MMLLIIYILFLSFIL